MRVKALELRGSCPDCGIWAVYWRDGFCLSCFEHRRDGHEPRFVLTGWCHLERGMAPEDPRQRAAIMYQRREYAIKTRRKVARA